MQALSSLAAKSLAPGQSMRITLRGNSMVPFLIDGDQLEVRNDSDLRKGDVVVFDLQGMLVAHRIVGFLGSKVIAKGDASRLPETVSREEIAGKVITVIRGSWKLEMNSFRARFYGALLPWSSLALRAFRKLGNWGLGIRGSG